MNAANRVTREAADCVARQEMFELSRRFERARPYQALHRPCEHYRNEVLKEISKHPTADDSDRSIVATAYIKMAVGDFNAILTEIGNENRGPAFKLFRLLYEDVVNGLWAQGVCRR